MAKPWYRNLHCVWNPIVKELTFNNNQDWTKFESAGIVSDPAAFSKE